MRFPVFHPNSDGQLVIGFQELNPFPGCNQIVVSNHAFIEEQYRGGGHGSVAHQDRLKLIKELGYDLVLCTSIAGNHVQTKILENNKWSRVASFKNRETGNWVYLWVRAIPQQGGECVIEAETKGGVRPNEQKARSKGR